MNIRALEETVLRSFPWFLAIATVLWVLGVPAAHAQASSLDPPTPRASLETDKYDYEPLSTAVISGTGFQPGEAVALQVLRVDGQPSDGPDFLPWTTVAGADGAFRATWRVCDCRNSLLELTATGLSSGLGLSTRFTDSYPVGKRVGYYDMSLGQGYFSQVAAILTAGETPVLLTDLDATRLAGVDVILVQNAYNFGFGSEYLSRLPAIASAVSAGKVLVIHDRTVTGAAGILPGGSGFTILRDFADSRNVEVLDDGTLVTHGPGGAVGPATLDGGCESNHGFAERASLPAGAKTILATRDPNHIVTFAYPYGAGWVVYSTIPLDFYLVNSHCNGPSFRNIYAPNVIAFATSLAFDNSAPAAANDSYATPEDTALTVAAPGVLGNDSDADGDALAAVLVSGPVHGTLTFNANGSFSYTPAANFNGSDSFTYKAGDSQAQSNVATVRIDVTPVNDPPAIFALAVDSAAIDENGTATVGVSFTDADGGDTHTAVVSWGDGTATTIALSGAKTFSASHRYADDQPSGTSQDNYTIGVTVTDAGGASSTASGIVAVSNVAPVIGSITGPTGPVAKDAATGVTATFTDVGSLDTHTCTIDWDDGLTTAGVVSGGGCTASHAYAAAGVYEPKVTITDDDTGSATTVFQYIVVYDASAGFVTGGGWVNSPAGAYTLDPGLAGKASFGFVSKYLRGATVPSGETQFQFHAAGFTFKSTSYEWLVISGARAQYKGSGTVNGGGDYGFLLTATDGDLAGGGGVDKFRIKVWRKTDGAVVYDNAPGPDDIGGSPQTALGGGSISIKK